MLAASCSPFQSRNRESYLFKYLRHHRRDETVASFNLVIENLIFSSRAQEGKPGGLYIVSIS